MPPRPKDGLDALIMAAVAAVILLLMLFPWAYHIRDQDAMADYLEIIFLSCWITAVILGIIGWKTRFGPTGLLICIVMIAVSCAFDPG